MFIFLIKVVSYIVCVCIVFHIVYIVFVINIGTVLTAITAHASNNADSQRCVSAKDRVLYNGLYKVMFLVFNTCDFSYVFQLLFIQHYVFLAFILPKITIQTLA